MKNRLKIYSKQNYRYNLKTSLLDFFCITVKKRKNRHGYKSLIQTICGLKKGRVFLSLKKYFLTSESVESTSLSLQSIDDVHGSDGLPLGVFSVSDSITDDIFQEDLEDTSGFFIDQARDTLDSTTTSQSANGGFGDTLDVITQNFAMTFGATLSKSFSSFTTSGHVDCLIVQIELDPM